MNGIKPKQFKSVVAEQHQEFRTAQQQDAEEYLRYLLERISNSTPPGVDDPTTTLKFKMETRFEDVASGMVRYTDKEEVVLGIPVHEVCLLSSAASRRLLGIDVSHGEEGRRNGAAFPCQPGGID